MTLTLVVGSQYTYRGYIERCSRAIWERTFWTSKKNQLTCFTLSHSSISSLVFPIMQLGKSAPFVKSCERTIGSSLQFIKACTMHWHVMLNMNCSLVWSTMVSSSMLTILWLVVCWAHIMKTWQHVSNPILVLILKPPKAKCKSAHCYTSTISHIIIKVPWSILESNILWCNQQGTSSSQGKSIKPYRYCITLDGPSFIAQ